MSRYLFTAFCFLFLGCEKEQIDTKKTQRVDKKEIPLHVKIQKIEKELNEINTTKYLEKYIETVINEGSNANLGFPAGTMDKGYAYKSDSLNIARYVVTLSGKKSSDDKKAKVASIFYTSNCGGCHGDKGKGLNGTFPNLTLPLLRGVDKRKTNLEMRLDYLKSKQK